MARYITLIIFFSLLCGSVSAQKHDEYEKMGDSLLQANAYETAIKYYDSALKTSSNPELLYRVKGLCYFHLGQMDKAQEQYYKALKINPRCLQCQYIILNALLYNRQHSIALQKADSILTLYADTGKKHLTYAYIKSLKANIYIDLNEMTAAEAVYDELIQDYPDSATSYFMSAEFNYLHSSRPKALKYINKAIELDSTNASYYFLKSKLYIVINYYKEADELIKKAITLDSSNGEYYGYRGSISYELKQLEPAKNDYIKAIELGASKGFYATMLTDLYMAKEDMDSLCYYTAMAKENLEKDTTDPDYKSYYTHIVFQKEEYCNPNISGYYYQRGVALFNQRLYDSAITYYTTGLKKFSNNAVIYNFRGNAYILTQQWQAAADDYLASLQYPENLMETARNRFKMDDPSKAGIYIKGLISSSYMGLAEAYIHLNHLDLAKKYADSALATLPIVADIPLYSYYNQLGRVYMAQGHYDSATSEFHKIISLLPNDPLGFINMAIATTFMAVKNTDNFIPYGISETWGGFNPIGSFKTRPSKLTGQQAATLQTALGYCDKAIALAENAGELYFVRSYIKYLKKSDSACKDMQRAKILGFEEAEDFMSVICK